jgi:5-hydroxyisourate hydrolase-like protein (transthyretin family)
MRRILLFLVLLIFFIGINVSSANDINGTDLETQIDNATADNTNLQAEVSSVQVLKSTNAKVVDKSSTIKAGDVTKYYKSSKKYTATFSKGNGKALANTKVKVTVKGKTYHPKTDGKGKISLAVNLKPGKYKVTSENPSTKFRLTTNFIVLSTIQSDDLTKVFNNTKKFKAKFLKSNGKPLSKRKVKYKFNNTVVTKRTDRNGVITVSLKDFKKGKYKIVFLNADGLKRTNKIKIVKSANTRMITHECTILSSSGIIKVKAKDQFGYKVPSGYVVKLKINGKTFKGKTNGNGIAKIKVKSVRKGIYTATYKFAAKKYYKSSKTTDRVYVIPSKTPEFTVKSTKTFGYGAHTPFKLRLSSGGVPLIKKSVTLKVKGKTYNKETDHDGMVSLPIDLAVGKYTVHCSVKKDSIINSKYVPVKIKVKNRTPTVITWVSQNDMYQGLNDCRVLLKDKDNRALSGKTVTLIVKSNTFSAVTNSKGYATFNAITPPGNYKVTFKFSATGDNNYAPCKSSAKINASYKVTSGYGYWLKMEQFESVTFDNLTSLSEQGVTDIFLNAKSVKAFGKERIENWIGNATTLGIKVHFWVQIFRNDSGWYSPIVDGKVNTAVYNQRIAEIKELSKVKGISGIHFDYIRFKNGANKYPGATDVINGFIKDACNAIRKINKELVISAAIMAKMENSTRKFAQDYSFISQCLDVVMPMIYKGNARQPTSWITSTTKWYVENSRGAKVWSGLQTYASDWDITVLPYDEMNNDAIAAMSGGAAGLVLFRWGLTSYIDYNQFKAET